jgi:Fe-Mn family superoxide dismutase
MNELVVITLCLTPLIAMTTAGLAAESDAGGFTRPPLPYAQDALDPYISAKTMSFHYGKHHQAYVDNLNKLIAKTAMAREPLEQIVKETTGIPEKAPIFNNAAQVWNHTFFWQSMKKGGGGAPDGRLLTLIVSVR